MSTRARVVQMEPPDATGGNALLVMVGLSVMFLLIVALLGAAGFVTRDAPKEIGYFIRGLTWKTRAISAK